MDKKIIIIIVSMIVIVINVIIILINNKITVNLKVDDQIIEQLSLHPGDLLTSIKKPVSSDGLFQYWLLNGQKYQNQELKDGDTLEAYFLKTFLVTYNPNNGEEVHSVTIMENELVAKPVDPKKVDYRFIGWYLNDKLFDFTQTIDGNIELIAKYEKIVVKKENKTNKGVYNIKVNTSSNKKLICKTLKAQGLSSSGVAAIMTNISFESSFNQTDYNGCYGLVQWCGGRFNKLKKYCGNQYSTVECQIKFMMSELKGYSKLLSNLKSNQSYDTLTNNFCSQYERPANLKKTCQKRANNSEKIYQYVINGCQ